MVNHYETYLIFQDIKHKRISFIAFFIIVFYKSSLDSEVCSIHSRLFTWCFYDIAHPYELFTSQYSRNDNSLVLS